MNAGQRRSRRALAAVINYILVASLLGAVPAVAAEAGSAVNDRSPAEDPYQLPAPASPPTEEQRLPVVDLSEIEGLWLKDVVEASLLPSDADSPEAFLENANLLPEEGSPTTDRYAFGPSDSSHLAVVYPQDVNRLTEAGEWRDIKIELVAQETGWRWDDPSGVTTTLPRELSSSTPLVISTPEGSVAVSPEGPATPGEREGQTVGYKGAFDHSELRYTATLGGIQEEIVVKEASKTSTFAFDVATAGLTLAPNEHGGIDVLSAGGEVVGVFPAPVAYDARDEPNSSTGTYTLTPIGRERARLEISIDERFLADAVYPVVIDPTWDDSPNRDGYTNDASPGTSYESDSHLQVGSGKRSYLRFDTGAISQAEVIVYDASLFLWPTGSGGVTGGVDAKRVTQNWPSPGTLKWNNQPNVGAVFDTTSSAGGNGWWNWDVTTLYQHYIDPANMWNTHWENEGVALTASNAKTFHSVNSELAP